MKDEWKIFGYAPMIIYRPDPQSMMVELAKSAMRMSIAREIEQDADKIWRYLLDLNRELWTVEIASEGATWWFKDGYSEYVHDRVRKIEEIPE